MTLMVNLKGAFFVTKAVKRKRDVNLNVNRCTVTLLRGGPNIQWIILVLVVEIIWGPQTKAIFFLVYKRVSSANRVIIWVFPQIGVVKHPPNHES